MGVRRGSIFKKCGINFPLNMDDFQLSHGIESEKILKAYFPEVCEEINGITDNIIEFPAQQEQSLFSIFFGLLIYLRQASLETGLRRMKKN